MKRILMLWGDETGQGMTEYALILGVMVLGVVGALRMFGTERDNLLSRVLQDVFDALD